MMSDRSIPAPDWITHADWGTSPGKRWLCVAEKRQGGNYLIRAPRPVTTATHLLSSLRNEAGEKATILIGFDFPIGLPRNYASHIGQTRFLDLLPQLGSLQWSDFYRPAERPDQISFQRPFYPDRPGGSRQRYLLEALNVATMNDLRRRCELARPGRRAAAPLFWTMGGQQVGKAAIAGWQEVLAPARRQAPPAALVWPFDGALAELLSPGETVVAETYPAEFYRHLDLNLGRVKGQRRFGKRSQASRKQNEEIISNWASRSNVHFTDELGAQVRDGFGDQRSGEDQFDAFVGVCGLVNLIVNDGQPVYEPDEAYIRNMEGWILGQSQDDRK